MIIVLMKMIRKHLKVSYVRHTFMKSSKKNQDDAKESKFRCWHCDFSLKLNVLLVCVVEILLVNIYISFWNFLYDDPKKADIKLTD